MNGDCLEGFAGHPGLRGPGREAPRSSTPYSALASLERYGIDATFQSSRRTGPRSSSLSE